jgi:hypothetical protein
MKAAGREAEYPRAAGDLPYFRFRTDTLYHARQLRVIIYSLQREER